MTNIGKWLQASAIASAASLAGIAATGSAQAQTVLTNSDGIVRNSLCVGFDCPGSISFSDTTILMMENNTRIKFGDTSSTSSFPNNDWEIEANSHVNGGANYLGFHDCGTNSNGGGCGSDLVFAVEAGARQSALYVESDGDVGFGTSNPVVELHAVRGDTPTLRLEQDGSSGFAPQTWDVAGNETSFFVRDATNGSRLPFRIFPNAPSNSLTIGGSTGHIGLGTTNPAVLLHLVRGGAGGDGLPRIEFDNTDGTEDWIVDVSDNNDFRISVDGSGSQEFIMTTAGDLTIEGTLTENSDRHTKTGIVAVDEAVILEKVAKLPISHWSHQSNADVRHIGPMAQDFYKLFGTGISETKIATIDLSGVALASIKAVSLKLDERTAQLELLEKESHVLRERIARLEKQVAN